MKRRLMPMTALVLVGWGCKGRDLPTYTPPPTPSPQPPNPPVIVQPKGGRAVVPSPGLIMAVIKQPDDPIELYELKLVIEGPAVKRGELVYNGGIHVFLDVSSYGEISFRFERRGVLSGATRMVVVEGREGVPLLGRACNGAPCPNRFPDELRNAVTDKFLQLLGKPTGWGECPVQVEWMECSDKRYNVGWVGCPGKVRVHRKECFPDEYLMAVIYLHEFLHSLGLHHTCGSFHLMGTADPPCNMIHHPGFYLTPSQLRWLMVR